MMGWQNNRFKGKNQFDTLEGKDNKTGLIFIFALVSGFSRHCPCNLRVYTGINADAKGESCPARISHKPYYSKVRNVYLQMKYIVKYGQPHSNQLADKKIRSLAGKIMARQ